MRRRRRGEGLGPGPRARALLRLRWPCHPVREGHCPRGHRDPFVPSTGNNEELCPRCAPCGGQRGEGGAVQGKQLPARGPAP